MNKDSASVIETRINLLINTNENCPIQMNEAGKIY